MKILAGRRAVVNPELKMAVALVEMCCFPPGNRRRTRTEVHEQFFCNKCNNPVTLTLSEVVETGEVWAEGPDSCSTCGYKIVAENPKFEPLSQTTIQKLFGQF